MKLMRVQTDGFSNKNKRDPRHLGKISKPAIIRLLKWTGRVFVRALWSTVEPIQKRWQKIV